ncbi:MAG: hypothetical protein JST86_15630 [Bacteroidetes bacterium]|nr:hypothetical protein [Bacteroidota bacterium]
MAEAQKKRKPWLKWILITGGVGLIAAVVIIYYLFTLKYDDTADTKSDYTVSAMDFLNEFKKNDSLANKKYTEKIITVRGRITELQPADTTINIQMTDTTSGSYVIFAFQQQHLAEARQLKVGDSVAIKGSCSGGTYSEILDAEKVEFKRSAVVK